MQFTQRYFQSISKAALPDLIAPKAILSNFYWFSYSTSSSFLFSNKNPVRLDLVSYPNEISELNQIESNRSDRDRGPTNVVIEESIGQTQNDSTEESTNVDIGLDTRPEPITIYMISQNKIEMHDLKGVRAGNAANSNFSRYSPDLNPIDYSFYVIKTVLNGSY